MSYISDKIIKHTIENSNFDTKRDYISLSHIHLPVEEILKMYTEGFEDSEAVRLKCYKGYQMEYNLLQRIKVVHTGKIGQMTIEAFDGLVKGHPDFSFEGYPADCKSVALDEWLPVNGKVSKKIYWQMQGYMLYAKKEKALLIYEGRQNGGITDIWIKQDLKVQSEIDRKCEFLVKEIEK